MQLRAHRLPQRRSCGVIVQGWPTTWELTCSRARLLHKRLQVPSQKLQHKLRKAVKSRSVESVCINNLLMMVHATAVFPFMLSCILAESWELFSTCRLLQKMFCQVFTALEFLQQHMQTLFSMWEIIVFPQKWVIAAPHRLLKGCTCHSSTILSRLQMTPYSVL